MAFLFEFLYINRIPHFDCYDSKEEQEETKLWFNTWPGEGREIQTEKRQMPTVLRQTDKKKPCDVFMVRGAGAVSNKLRCIIEEFEPDIHEFFPIEVFDQNRVQFAEEYYILNVVQQFDAHLVKLHPTKHSGWMKTTDTGRPFLSIDTNKLVLSSPKISGRHLWMSQHIGAYLLFVSDELGERLRQEKIRWITLTKIEETEDEWIPEDNVAPVLEWIENHPEGEGHCINE